MLFNETSYLAGGRGQALTQRSSQQSLQVPKMFAEKRKAISMESSEIQRRAAVAGIPQDEGR